ncbi:vWA domain-containing protein [Arachidicoccus terrestris]|uniref:vWA domain-containing protein n=1 Tax=Arachidicoccus terrestris TaxID=2875539 RepID=UPI001CC3F094|nr:vWA domain-containing protein [Arachidicoccus terrestris]UAY55684.1 VWA domain-containing protein [Arachidicoccus terrestris]
MAYTAEISRTNPSCFLFIIDQSSSMADRYRDIRRPKADAVADVINRMLQQLVIKCAKSEGIRDYYYVGVLGYHEHSVNSALKGILAGKEFLPISEVAAAPLRMEERVRRLPDEAGGLVEMPVKFPVWLDPVADGGTPMVAAFTKANQLIEKWLRSHPNSFPPVVIHITDGESTDGPPSRQMQLLTEQRSSDGSVLLFNLHTHTGNIESLSFPGPDSNLLDPYAKLLFDNASELPEFMLNVAKREFDLKLPQGARAFVLNGSIDLIITAIEIGTRPRLQLK